MAERGCTYARIQVASCDRSVLHLWPNAAQVVLSSDIVGATGFSLPARELACRARKLLQRCMQEVEDTQCTSFGCFKWKAYPMCVPTLGHVRR